MSATKRKPNVPKPDPALAVISDYKAAYKQWLQAARKLEAAEIKVRPTHGRRPIPLIHWRNYMIGGSEIEIRRKRLLAEPGANATEIEAEYLDAKKCERALKKAERDWYKHPELSDPFARHKAALRAWLAAEHRLCDTKAKTPRGASGMLAIVRDSIRTGDASWHDTALKTIVAALHTMRC